MVVCAVSHQNKHLVRIQLCLCHYCVNRFFIIIHSTQKRLSRADLPEQSHVFHQTFRHGVIFNPVNNMSGLDDYFLHTVCRHTFQRLSHCIYCKTGCPLQLTDNNRTCKGPVYAGPGKLFRRLPLNHRNRLFQCIQMACTEAYDQNSFFHTA